MPVGKSHSIRFEVSAEKKLAALAAVSGVSPEKMIREIVTDKLNDADGDHIRHRLHQVETQLTGLRQDLATAVEALMVINTTNGKLTREEIKAWVQENLFRRG
ncbi:MAG: hypothetical protein ABL974_06655 [Prosthecobacter sp.]|jgi:predicted DNA-binding protein